MGHPFIVTWGVSVSRPWLSHLGWGVEGGKGKGESPLLDTFEVFVLSLLLFHDVGFPPTPTLSLDDKKVIHAQGEGHPPPFH